MASYEQQDIGTSVSIDLDPTLDQGDGIYQISYWVGIRTPEVGSGGNVEAYATDRLGFLATSGHPGSLNGGDLGSVQGCLYFQYAGTSVPTREFHFDITVFAPNGDLRYDYRLQVLYLG